MRTCASELPRSWPTWNARYSPDSVSWSWVTLVQSVSPPPLSIVRGAGEAADKGILMRTGEAFQAFRLVKQIIFEKTGTLTIGEPTVREVESAKADEDELLGLAAAVESASEHPLAQAIVSAAFERGLTPPPVKDFEAIPGKGVVATVAKRRVVVGSPGFLKEQGVELESIEESIVKLEDSGRTVLVVARDDQALGAIAVGDELRPDAHDAILALNDAGVRTIMLTGDNERAARIMASAAGIEEVHAGILPGDKAELVRSLQKKGMVAMVGDGINDAPALMQADVGVAMGSGTDIAIESADIIILSNRMASVPAAQEVSRRSYRKMVQNVTLAFMFNGIGIPIAATGLIYPIWAMMAMAVSVTAIFINSIGGRPALFFDAISTIGQTTETAD